MTESRLRKMAKAFFAFFILIAATNGCYLPVAMQGELLTKWLGGGGGSHAEEDRTEALAATLVHQLRQAHGHQLRVCVGCFESGGSRNGGYGDQESDSDAGDW